MESLYETEFNLRVNRKLLEERRGLIRESMKAWFDELAGMDHSKSLAVSWRRDFTTKEREYISDDWIEPILSLPTLLTGFERPWRETVAELEREMVSRKPSTEDGNEWKLQVWQRNRTGLIIAVIRSARKREVWLLQFLCQPKHVQKNLRSMRHKVERVIRKRLNVE